MYECKSLYLLLQRHDDNIVGTISQGFHHTLLKSMIGLYRVRVELHNMCKCPTCIQVATQATENFVAKRKAFSEVIKILGKSLVGGVIAVQKSLHSLGDLAGKKGLVCLVIRIVNGSVKSLIMPSGTLSTPNATPTAAEAALIAASSIDLEALTVVAAQAAQVARTLIPVIEVEKHEADQSCWRLESSSWI
jgi:hypothetical protein